MTKPICRGESRARVKLAKQHAIFPRDLLLPVTLQLARPFHSLASDDGMVIDACAESDRLKARRSPNGLRTFASDLPHIEIRIPNAILQICSFLLISGPRPTISVTFDFLRPPGYFRLGGTIRGRWTNRVKQPINPLRLRYLLAVAALSMYAVPKYMVSCLAVYVPERDS